MEGREDVMEAALKTEFELGLNAPAPIPLIAKMLATDNRPNSNRSRRSERIFVSSWILRSFQFIEQDE